MSPSNGTPIALLVFAALALAGCHRADSAYTPGLGEIMALQQMRHSKLWLAGQAANWELAAYETDELDEGFEAAMQFHPQHKSSPMPLTRAIPDFTAVPLQGLHAAIAAKDPKAFTAAFDALTVGCNACHLATQFAFNVVVRPTGNGFLNQDFTPHAH